VDSRAFYEYALSSLHLNIGSKYNSKGKRRRYSRHAAKKSKPGHELRVVFKLDLKESSNQLEKIMHSILKRNFDEQKYSQETGFYRYIQNFNFVIPDV
jgi:carbonic anhydrase